MSFVLTLLSPWYSSYADAHRNSNARPLRTLAGPVVSAHSAPSAGTLCLPAHPTGPPLLSNGPKCCSPVRDRWCETLRRTRYPVNLHAVIFGSRRTVLNLCRAVRSLSCLRDVRRRTRGAASMLTFALRLRRVYRLYIYPPVVLRISPLCAMCYVRNVVQSVHPVGQSSCYLSSCF
jgi:hypothetical protein